MITQIATVAVYVEDQEKALDFWTRAMGFVNRSRREMEDGHAWVEVAPAGAASSLVLYPRPMMKDWRERKPSIVFSCTDLFRFCAEIRGRGVEFVQEPKLTPWGAYAVFRDTEGNEFVLHED